MRESNRSACRRPTRGAAAQEHPGARERVRHDGATAARNSAGTRKALEDDERKPCREAIGDLRIEAAALREVELSPTNAEAELDNGESWRPDLRVLLVLYLLLIATGLSLYITIGLMAQ
jgi:hypothetical protein